jgi:hypothetical protein
MLGPSRQVFQSAEYPTTGEFMWYFQKAKRSTNPPTPGKPAAVLQDEAYQRLLDLAAARSAVEGIRQGVEDVAQGRMRPALEVFDEIRAEYGIPC